MQYLWSRLKDPQTHAGLATIALGLGALFPEYNWLAQGAAFFLGGNAVILPGHKPQQ